MSYQETSFVTIGQRFLADPLRWKHNSYFILCWQCFFPRVISEFVHEKNPFSKVHILSKSSFSWLQGTVSLWSPRYFWPDISFNKRWHKQSI
jgi:hypothetical protein